MLDPWLRLHAHALLRESRIFPGIKLYDEVPDCSCHGFADIWKGDYRGELVCVKVVRTRDRARLMEIEKVRLFFILLPEAYSARFIPDVPSCKRAWSSSEPASNRPDFGDTLSTLHPESMDAGWEYRPVYPDEPRGQPADAGACLSDLIIIDDDPPTPPTTACTSVQRPGVPSWDRYSTRKHHSGRPTEGMSKPAR